MAEKAWKLAILRARHDPDAELIGDAACAAMLMTNGARRAVLDYWETVTDGYLQFAGSTLLPWVDVELGADTSRENQVAKAHAATAALPGVNLAGFNGFIVLSLPGTVTIANPDAGKPGQPDRITVGIDGGAGPLAGGKPACALPVMTVDHTFCCHEVGHVLGFEHSYGVWNNGIEWDGEAPYAQGQVYGDPYDVMSSASFGTRNLDPKLSRYFGNPIFVGPAVVGWPNPNAFGMGPEPARAHVHQWQPEAFPPGRVAHVVTPAGGAVRRQRLVSAAAHRPGVSLLVIHPVGEDAEGRGRCYVEYRQRIGWDQGLDLSGGDLARQAVVVHALADAPGDGVRCWYRGRILVPLELDGDLAVEDTPLVVRVLDVAEDGGSVDIEVSAAVPPRELTIERRNYETLLAERDSRPMGTPCGDTIVSATRIWQTTTHYRPTTRGFGGIGAPDVASPVLTWTVAGQTVAPGAGTVEVTTEAGQFTVQYELDADTGVLVLVARGGERYAAEVVATATEAGGANPVTATARFDPVGWSEGFSAADLAKLDRCITRRYRQVRIRLRDWLVPPGPDPLRPGLAERINAGRLRAIAGIFAERAPAEARALAALIDLRYRDPQVPDPPVTALPPAARLEALRAVGIDHSVPAAELLRWLGNADHTPYPALADALASLLGGRRLARPVFLDVVVWNYEHTPGLPSPRRDWEVDPLALEAAVLAGFNQRHGVAERRFADLLTS